MNYDEQWLANISYSVEEIKNILTVGAPVLLQPGEGSGSIKMKNGTLSTPNPGMVAFGKWNDPVESSLFEVGFGTDADNKKTAFRATNNGDIVAYRNVCAQNGAFVLNKIGEDEGRRIVSSSDENILFLIKNANTYVMTRTAFRPSQTDTISLGDEYRSFTKGYFSTGVIIGSETLTEDLITKLKNL